MKKTITFSIILTMLFTILAPYVYVNAESNLKTIPGWNCYYASPGPQSEYPNMSFKVVNDVVSEGNSAMEMIFDYPTTPNLYLSLQKTISQSLLEPNTEYTFKYKARILQGFDIKSYFQFSGSDLEGMDYLCWDFREGKLQEWEYYSISFTTGSTTKDVTIVINFEGGNTYTNSPHAILWLDEASLFKTASPENTIAIENPGFESPLNSEVTEEYAYAYSGGADLRWSDTTGYNNVNIYSKDNAGNLTFVSTVARGVGSYDVTGLTDTKEYTYVLKASDDVFESAGTEVKFTPMSTDSVVPAGWSFKMSNNSPSTLTHAWCGVTATEKTDGNNSAHIMMATPTSSLSNAYAMLEQNITVQPSTTYVIKAKTKSSGVATAAVQVDYNYEAFDGGGAQGITGWDIHSWDWEEITLFYTTGNSQTTIPLQIAAYWAKNTMGSLWVDDVRVYEESDGAQTNLVTNPSMERIDYAPKLHLLNADGSVNATGSDIIIIGEGKYRITSKAINTAAENTICVVIYELSENGNELADVITKNVACVNDESQVITMDFDFVPTNENANYEIKTFVLENFETLRPLGVVYSRETAY